VSAAATDETAFRELVEPYRRELHAHCYRMLGSVHDADDAIQDAMLRAWRGLAKFEGRSSLRSWLYRIATNTCLDQIGKRPKLTLPTADRPAIEMEKAFDEPPVERVWIDPYPDIELAAAEDDDPGPATRYEQHESLELAFVVALQLLPPNQRAALILREVLGFSAAEVAEALDTSVPSVNSALQRARRTVEDALPERSQQATLEALVDDGLREVVEGYMEAMEGGDVERMLELLADDAAWSMPPLRAWFRGKDRLEGFLRLGPLSGEWRWRHRATTVNGQATIGSYAWFESEGAYLPFALDVLRVDAGGHISEVISFINRVGEGHEPAAFARWPELEQHAERTAVFVRTGLPERLPA